MIRYALTWCIRCAYHWRMTYAEAVSFFKTPAQLARAMGVSTPSVMEWKSGIPETRQYQVELATGGVLKADKPALRIDFPVSA